MINDILFVSFGFVIGVIGYITYNYIRNIYLKTKTELHIMRLEKQHIQDKCVELELRRNRLMNEIQDIKEFMNWRLNK